MMCLQCGDEIDAGVALCPLCGKSPYEPPSVARPANSPASSYADELLAGLSAPASQAPPPESIPIADLSESQQRRVAFLTQKLEKEPNQPKALLNLAQVYEEAGDFPTAITYYKACLAADHLNGYAAGRLAILEANHPGAGDGPRSGSVPRTGEVAGGTGSGALRDPGTGSARLREPRTGDAGRIEPRPTTGALRQPGGTGRVRPDAPRTALDAGRSDSKARAWYAQPMLWVGVIVALAVAGGVGAFYFERASHFVVLGEHHISFGASFSRDGRFLAVYEPDDRPGMEATMWGYSGSGQSHVRVISASGSGVIASFAKAAVAKESPSPVWGGARYVAYPTSGSDYYDPRVAIGDLETKTTGLTLEGSHAAISPDGRFVAYEKGVGVAEDQVGPYRNYGHYKPTRPEIFVYTLASREEKQLTTTGGTSPVWSPDSSQVLYQHQSFGEVMKTGIAVDRDDMDEDGRYHPHSYSYKSKRFLGVDLDVIPRDGGEPTVVATGGSNAYAAWVGTDNHTISWVHWESEAEDDEYGMRSLRNYGSAEEKVALQASLMLGNSAGGAGDEILGPQKDAIRLDTAAWSPDGQRLVFERVVADSTMIVANRREGAKLSDFKDETDLHVYDRATKSSKRLNGEGNPHRTRPVWSPDGKRLAYTLNEWGIPRVEVASLGKVLPK